MPVPSLKLDVNETVYVKITSEILQEFGKKREFTYVTNLATGEEQRMIALAVLGNVLRDAYPNDGYVGKYFQIEKLKQPEGKKYFEFDVAELALSVEVAQRINNLVEQNKLEKISTAIPESMCWWKPSESQDRDEWYHREYLKSPQWKKIRKRTLKRDDNCCYRCGGKAATVHHRSYADGVMKGEDDSRLAAICEGCHAIIHYEDSGNKRSVDETDQLLLGKAGTDFPTPKVDLRKVEIQPAEWKRMSAVQRAAYSREYQRLRYLRWLQKPKAPVRTLRKLLHNCGMDDRAIDVAITKGPAKARTKAQG